MSEFFRVNYDFTQPYDYFKCITIVNPKQAAFYCANGVKLRDVRLSKDRKDGSDVFLFYFYKEDTFEVYDAWCRKEH